MLEIGNPIIYVDPRGKERPALVTAVWSQNCCNLVFVHDDEGREDTYGRQIDRKTSVTHDCRMDAPGNFWKYGDDRDKDVT